MRHPLTCPLVSRESVAARGETCKCLLAYAARRTWAVSTALGTSAGVGSLGQGRWGLGGLRLETRIRFTVP
jgi:hypothetical protein